MRSSSMTSGNYEICGMIVFDRSPHNSLKIPLKTSLNWTFTRSIIIVGTGYLGLLQAQEIYVNMFKSAFFLASDTRI